MGRDSNPRYLAVHTLSRRAQSTTLAPILDWFNTARGIQGKKRWFTPPCRKRSLLSLRFRNPYEPTTVRVIAAGCNRISKQPRAARFTREKGPGTVVEPGRAPSARTNLLPGTSGDAPFCRKGLFGRLLYAQQKYLPDNRPTGSRDGGGSAVPSGRSG